MAQPQISLSNVASSGKIKISWEKIDGAVKYEVWRATSKTGTYSKLTTTTNTSVTNTSAIAGKTYYYKVKAISSNSSANSEYSAVKSRVCDLAKVSIKLSNRASDGAITIKWDAVAGATKYQVYRATSKSGQYTKLATTSSISYNDVSGTAGKTYYYKVRAICNNTEATGVYSSVQSCVRCLANPDVKITRQSGKPYLQWDKVSNAAGYRVYRATSKNGTYSLMKNMTSRSFKDTSAKNGKTYYYKVVAVCKTTSGNSAYSSVVSIKATK